LPPELLFAVFRYTYAYPHGRAHLVNVHALVGPCKFTIVQSTEQGRGHMYDIGRKQDRKHTEDSLSGFRLFVCKQCRDPIYVSHYSYLRKYWRNATTAYKSSFGVCGVCIGKAFNVKPVEAVGRSDGRGPGRGHRRHHAAH